MLLNKKRESVVSLIQELFALFEAEVKKALLKKKKSNERLRTSKNFRKTLRNTLDQMGQFRSKIRVSMEYLKNSFEKILSLEERRISIQRTTKTLSYGRRSVPRRESDQS
jgi:flagellar biosynthesis/type III secretory pathway chaperone